MIIELIAVLVGGTIFGLMTGFYIGDRRIFNNSDRGLEEMYSSYE